jgi:hypothetical protein
MSAMTLFTITLRFILSFFYGFLNLFLRLFLFCFIFLWSLVAVYLLFAEPLFCVLLFIEVIILFQSFIKETLMEATILNLFSCMSFIYVEKYY